MRSESGILSTVRKCALGAVGAVLLAVGVTPGTAQASPQACASLEGCYGYNGMRPFYDEVISLIDQFSKDTYEDMPAPRDYYYIPDGSIQQAGTGCSAADGTAFFLCRSDDTIYVGQQQLWDFYNVDGDAAAAFAVAHEWGHHVQLSAGVFEQVSTRQDRIDAENQADCIGGAFLKNLDGKGILEPDDYSDMGSILPKIASAEGPDRDHGTVEERIAATQFGLDNGIDACSQFFPNAPLLT